MRVFLLAVLVAGPALAENQLTERDRQMIAQQDQARQAVYARARERCIENRGVDCFTEQGLREWVLLDRSREAAVLDQIAPLPTPGGFVPSAGSGSTTPAAGR